MACRPAGLPLVVSPSQVLLLLSPLLILFYISQVPDSCRVLCIPCSFMLLCLCAFLPSLPFVQRSATSHLQASDHTLSSWKQPLTFPGMLVNCFLCCPWHPTHNPILYSFWPPVGRVCVCPSVCAHCQSSP